MGRGFLRPAEVDFRLFAQLLVFLVRAAVVVRWVEAVRPAVDFLRRAATFERVLSPEAAPIRAPDTAPVKAPVTARLKNPPVRLAASTVFFAPAVDLDFFLAMYPNLNEVPGEIKSPNDA